MVRQIIPDRNQMTHMWLRSSNIFPSPPEQSQWVIEMGWLNEMITNGLIISVSVKICHFYARAFNLGLVKWKINSVKTRVGFGERPWERAGNGVDTRLIMWLVLIMWLDNKEQSHWRWFFVRDKISTDLQVRVERYSQLSINISAIQ